MQSALISVVLPVFNAERTISVALASVLEQTYDRLEVITVDDGSTDSSPELLADLAMQDHRISIIRTANRGVASARNTGLAQSRGELIAVMDADDICEPSRFQKQLAHLEQHRSCVAVGCRVTAINENGVPCQKQLRFASGAPLKDRCKNFRHFPPSPPTLPHPTAMIRSAALKSIGGYRTYFRVAEDRDLWWRLSELGQIHCLPDCLLSYRVHAGSASRTDQKQNVADALLSDLSAIARYFGLNDVELLEKNNSTRMPSDTIQQYARLIGKRYPVSRLASFRAITRRSPSLAGYPDRSSAMRYSISQLLRNPLSKKRYQLVAAALSL